MFPTSVPATTEHQVALSCSKSAQRKQLASATALDRHRLLALRSATVRATRNSRIPLRVESPRCAISRSQSCSALPRWTVTAQAADSRDPGCRRHRDCASASAAGRRSIWCGVHPGRSEACVGRGCFSTAPPPWRSAVPVAVADRVDPAAGRRAAASSAGAGCAAATAMVAVAMPAAGAGVGGGHQRDPAGNTVAFSRARLSRKPPSSSGCRN